MPLNSRDERIKESQKSNSANYQNVENGPIYKNILFTWCSTEALQKEWRLMEEHWVLSLGLLFNECTDSVVFVGSKVLLIQIDRDGWGVHKLFTIMSILH